MDTALYEVIESPPLDLRVLAERAMSLCDEFQALFGCPLCREMGDYGSVKLVLWLDAAFQPVANYSLDSVYMVKTILSSRDSLFTFVFLKGRMKQVWYPMDPTALMSELLTYKSIISNFLERHNYLLLEGPVLDELAPGHVTELDGVPATIFQVLFAEIV